MLFWRALTMDSNVSQNDKKTRTPSIEALIETQWEIMNTLKEMLNNPELTTDEKTHVANAFALQANVLNRFMKKTGAEKDSFEEQNLGDYLQGVEPRISRRVRRDFRVWKRRLSSKRY